MVIRLQKQSKNTVVFCISFVTQIFTWKLMKDTQNVYVEIAKENLAD